MASLASLFLFASLLHFSINGSPVKPSNSACPSSDCGNDLVFSYPFWVQNQQSQYCGYPGFGLSCSGREPMLQLSGDLYQVRKINSSENTLTIAYPEVTAGICPVARYGVTLNTSSLLNYTIDDKMVRFFYNCTLYPPSLPSIACLQYGAKRSYVFMEGAIPEFDWQRYCDSIVTVPVIDSDLQLINGFGRALQDGFKLAWQPDVACQSCEATGGFCGYDNGNGNGLHPNPKFVCFCADGQHFANCRDKGVVSVAFEPNLVLIGALIFGSLIIASTGFYLIRRKKINLQSPVFSRIPSSGK